MASRWRWLIWAVPLGLVASTFALSWHLDPDFWRSPASLMRLAQEAGQRGDQPRALELARKAVSREPKNADYSLSLGQICLEAGQPQETLDLIRRLNPQEAKTSRGLKLQALALDRLGDRQAALKLLAGGLEDNPEDAELLVIAAALAAQGSYDRPLAITYYSASTS
ncbi:MAG: tetratricopeptide repeat protein [Deltaproteobacteria bacterium]|nr:tetratricopeptide repeat protein [Deltaproteobacteria bacterium]